MSGISGASEGTEHFHTPALSARLGLPVLSDRRPLPSPPELGSRTQGALEGPEGTASPADTSEDDLTFLQLGHRTKRLPAFGLLTLSSLPPHLQRPPSLVPCRVPLGRPEPPGPSPRGLRAPRFPGTPARQRPSPAREGAARCLPVTAAVGGWRQRPPYPPPSSEEGKRTCSPGREDHQAQNGRRETPSPGRGAIRLERRAALESSGPKSLKLRTKYQQVLTKDKGKHI